MSDTPGQPGPSSQPQPQAGPSKAASSWKPQYSETGPGPSLQTYRRHPERAYGGPNPDSLSNARTPEQAEQYWKRVRAVEGPPLPRFGRLMGIGGWVLSGGKFADLNAELTTSRRVLHGRVRGLWRQGARLQRGAFTGSNESQCLACMSLWGFTQLPSPDSS